jgi:hypothetical protein
MRAADKSRPADFSDTAPRSRGAVRPSHACLFRPTEGVGNAGCPMHPQPRVRSVESTRVSHHRSTRTTRHSRTRWFTAYSALSPVIGLSCHRHLAHLLARLDAGVEASGPHGFAVREFGALVRSAARVHRIPPRVRDDRERPSVGRDGGSFRDDLPDGLSEIFFARGLDRANQLDPAQQISLPAHGNPLPFAMRSWRQLHFFAGSGCAKLQEWPNGSMMRP